MKIPEIFNFDIINSNLFAAFEFDSIICDPPYGNKFINSGWKVNLKKNFTHMQILMKLLDFSYALLKVNGRLVYLYPYQDKSTPFNKNMLPTH